MRQVVGPLPGAPTTNAFNGNSTTEVERFGPSIYIARHPGEELADYLKGQLAKAKVGARAKKFYTQQARLALDAALRSESLSEECRCVDPFSTHHREVCMRFKR